jgi:hypothetical protein
MITRRKALLAFLAVASGLPPAAARAHSLLVRSESSFTFTVKAAKR